MYSTRIDFTSQLNELPTVHTEALLERAYSDFHVQYHRERDPVGLVHSYSNPKDQELVAFIAALLAYGNVATILASVHRILDALGPSPQETIRKGLFPDRLRHFRHRFTTGEDLEVLFAWLSHVFTEVGTLEDFFISSNGSPNSSMKDLLSRFVCQLTRVTLPKRLAVMHELRSRNLKYLLSDPNRGSACKRLNMFLRWMVRKPDGIDLGLWTRCDPAQLMLPVDTHLLQTLRRLRWTVRKQATWRVVESATRRLRRYCPKDPVRYDFALCHLSMSGWDIRRYPYDLTLAR